MRFFSKNIDLYNMGQWARRAGVRMMGLVVALFASARADAAEGIMGTACPGCVTYGGTVCDSGSTYGAYDDGTGIGTQYAYCINADIRDAYDARIYDADCVALLKSWGMCDAMSSGSQSAGLEMLYNPDLNCTTASEWAGYYVEYGGNTYEYNRDISGYVEFYGNFTATDSHICCDASGGIGSAPCCVSSYSCLEDYVYCGYCNGQMYSLSIYDSGDMGNAQTCTDAFEAYFSYENNSSGWCDGSGIMVEATGAMLIAQACWGATTISGASSYGMQSYCGVVITGCDADNGYWFNGDVATPYDFVADGSAHSCNACPAPVSGYDSGHNFSINGGTGIGVESCYATAGTATISLTDTTGTYQETITADCPYTE